MDKVIYKYPLGDGWRISGKTTVMMPDLSTVLHFNLQNEIPTIWALVNPEAEMVERAFHIVGTGHLVPGNYFGTCFDNQFVWHLFEVQP